MYFDFVFDLLERQEKPYGARGEKGKPATAQRGKGKHMYIIWRWFTLHFLLRTTACKHERNSTQIDIPVGLIPQHPMLNLLN